MAEAHECVRAAQLTIETVHCIISADSTIFTASLVISGRLLWAQHGENVVDEAAVKDSKILLSKAEKIFHELDRENSLVLSCLEYICRLARMCSIKEAAPNTSEGCSDTDLALNPAVSNSQPTFDPATGSAEPVLLNVEDMEAFQLFSSEMFDPSIFEGFHQPPVEGITLSSGLWDGSPCGGL
ncbi:hypothetical protein ASPWEDRAFT_183615 [Aspergillus wentii DTO 134E9]|uniref:Uncharacterized protein n=1 Tax=Aspergillus wentii DTO 134E9 TaxID=1073089 RepID=A0A1L9RL59_ASPWE|nr:uncharacterized protein ASPWEDRAFT_183615 [Aspergillus wentii DTO 134E9]KAI9924668.1 hypothetical protein MW887_006943 [Aspergillus wentii]OJJ35568.1 hypothetical protein ASPWEDRAFT_183615 [Aspergillus wentii DTO 134E9]